MERRRERARLPIRHTQLSGNEVEIVLTSRALRFIAGLFYASFMKSFFPTSYGCDMVFI